MSFAEGLRQTIASKGLTLRRISKGTGIPESTLSEWTAGREPRLGEAVVKLARFLGTTLEALVCSTDGDAAERAILADAGREIARRWTTVHKGVYRVTVQKESE